MEAITYQISTEEGVPVMDTISIEDQKEWTEKYGTIQELIEYNRANYRHWQADC